MCSNNDGHSILDELNDDGGVENTRNTAIKEEKRLLMHTCNAKCRCGGTNG